MYSMFFIDEILLRSLGIVLGPFDLFYILEIIEEYSRGLYIQEQLKELRNKIKENRLYYELGESTLKEYSTRNDNLNKKLKKFEKTRKINFPGRINLLG